MVVDVCQMYYPKFPNRILDMGSQMKRIAVILPSFSEPFLTFSVIAIHSEILFLILEIWCVHFSFSSSITHRNLVKVSCVRIVVSRRISPLFIFHFERWNTM